LVTVLVAIDFEEEEPVQKADVATRKRLAKIKFCSTAFYVPSTLWLRGRRI